MKKKKLVITGNAKLEGEVSICGAKNSSIAILPATLLCNGVCTLHNVPNIVDISSAVLAHIQNQAFGIVITLNYKT